jgi:HAMP domain-containing protein
MAFTLRGAGFLRTRVGRRTLASFMGAALLPATILSMLGIWYVRQALANDANERLQSLAKSLAVTVLGELASSARALDASSADSIASHDFASRYDAAAIAHLHNGGVLLRVDTLPATKATSANSLSLRLLRELPDGRIAMRRLQEADLWSTIDEIAGDDRVAMCIIEIGTWRRVHCGASVTPTIETKLRKAAMDALPRGAGDAGTSDRISTHRDLYLRFSFATTEWRLVTSEDRAEALAPAHTVTVSLLLTLLLSAVTAFTMAHLQIRRSTVPLEALRDATRRVASGDLTSTVNVEGKDEYGELGDSFNRMTHALGRQMSLLHRMDAVDEVALRERHIETIVLAALEGFSAARADAHIGITLTDDFDATASVEWSLDAQGRAHAAPRVMSTSLTAMLVAQPRSLRLPVSPVVGNDTATTPSRVMLALIHDERVLGAVSLDDRLTDEQMHDARRIADRVALAIANVRLVTRLDALSIGTLKAFARAIDANSSWTAGHSERVTRLAVLLGQEVGLSAAALTTLYRGGLMHDIGKIGVPVHVLDKAGQLSDAERAMIEHHPEVGERILAPIPAFADVLPIVRSHHERYDGTGYPDRLAGEAIPRLARVLAIADVFDALTSDRPYRAGLSPCAALVMIAGGAGTHFDPELAVAFARLDPELLTPLPENAPSFFHDDDGAIRSPFAPTLAGVS